MTTTNLCGAGLGIANGKLDILTGSRKQNQSTVEENRSSKMYKSKQTAFRLVDLKSVNDKSTFCNGLTRSKSQADFSIDRRRRSLEKERRDNLQLKQEVSEWFHIYSSKKKINLWADRLERMAQKLRRPGGEEKLRSKIEKCIDKIPSQLSDNDRREFRQQLPDDIIRKLKKMYVKNEDTSNSTPINVFRSELPKCYFHFENDKVKTVIRKWSKAVNFKRKDFLGRSVKKDDILEYMMYKLKPLVDMPDYDVTEYKYILQTCIMEILEELPVAHNGCNKREFLIGLTESLTEELLTINKIKRNKITRNVSVDCQLNKPERGVQHNNIPKQLQSLVTVEINDFLEKSGICISTERLKTLKAELAYILLDTFNSIRVEINDNIKYDISNILQEIVNLPEYQADDFADTLYEHVKGIFYPKKQNNYTNSRCRKSQTIPKISSSYSESYFVFHNQNQNLCDRSTTDLNIRQIEETDININLENYTKLLQEHIDEWLNNIDVPLAQCKASRQVVVKGLAEEIADRHKYLQLNPNSKDTDELENLKYQIFKWINKLIGEDNMETIECANELMQRLQSIPVPALIRPLEATYQDLPACSQTHVPPVIQKNSYQQYFTEQLTDKIFDWFYELSQTLHSSEDAVINSQLIKDLAERINESLKLSQNLNDIIDKEVNLWTKMALKENVQDAVIEHLKQILKNIPFSVEDYIEGDPRKDKLSIRKYEDIIENWIERILLEPKGVATFIGTWNEYIHELAVKVYKTKIKMARLTNNEVITSELHDDILNLLKKLPLHSQANRESYKDLFARKLVKNIKESNLEDLIDSGEMCEDQELAIRALETAIVDWLKALPLYRNITTNNKQNQDRIIRDLTTKIYQDALGLSLNQASERDRIQKSVQKDYVQSYNRLKAIDTSYYILKQEIIEFIKKITVDLDKKCNVYFLSNEAESLLKQLAIVPVEGFSRKIPPINSHRVREAITNWLRNLPLKPNHCPKQVQCLIDQMIEEITREIIHLEYCTIEENQDNIERIIFKYLKSSPLKLNQQSELFDMVTTLWEDLKCLYADHKNLNVIQNVTHDMTVYGVSFVNSRRNVNRNENTDISLQGIHEDDINTILNLYLNQLTGKIDKWLTSLQIPEVNEKEFRNAVVSDLAGDIIDRHKYLELNPSSRGTDEDELEHLKYQIFKWINKLAGEDNLVTIEHASELMQEIQSLPFPRLVKPQELQESQRDRESQPRMKIAKQMSMFSPAAWPGGSTTERTQQKVTKNISNSTEHTKDQTINSSGSQIPINSNNKIETFQDRAQNTATTPSSSNQPTGNTNKQKNLPMFGPEGPGGSLKESTRQVTFGRTSNPGELSMPKNPQSIPQCKTLNEALEYFYNAIRRKLEELPLATPTPEQETLAVLAKRGMFNAIAMNFHNMKSDPEIGNDYGLFELIFEDRLDLLLDCVPQTPDMLKIRQVWKVKVIQLATDLLKYIHKTTDSQSFRRQVARGIRRTAIKTNLEQQSDRIMHDFIVKTANDFILYSNYKEEDPLKANIYRQRLMKKLEELAKYATTTGNTEFRFIDRFQLCRDAFRVLETVPRPINNELKDEADIILLDEEIEQWYNELPVKPISSESDNVLRNRMRELLAKKIHEMENQIGMGDPSIERSIKHEVSLFLHDHGQLEEDQDLNINFMVDELNNKLKRRRQQHGMLGYQTFEKDKPLSSTFVQPEPVEALATLVDVQTDTSQDIPGPSGYPKVMPMPKEFVTNQQGQFYHGSPSRLSYVDVQTAGHDCGICATGAHAQISPVAGAGMIDPGFAAEYPLFHSLGPAQIANHVPLGAPNLQGSHVNGSCDQELTDKARPIIQVPRPSSHEAPCNPCGATLQDNFVSAAINRRFLEPDIQVSGKITQGMRPCRSASQYTGSGKFYSSNPRYLGSTVPMPAQGATSTRIYSTGVTGLEGPDQSTRSLGELEEDEERVDVRERCRCMDRFRRRMRRRYCYSCYDDIDDCTRFYRMPFRCRCHY